MSLAFAIFLTLVILGSNRSEARPIKLKKLTINGRLNPKTRMAPVVKKSTGRMKS